MSVFLISDFLGSIRPRGIAGYVRDLELLLGQSASVTVLRAPAWVGRLPPSIQNLLAVLHEQFWVPIVALWLRPRRVIYPYNSAALLSAFFATSVIVIHDLIPYRRASRRVGLAYCYIAVTSWLHCSLGRDVIAVSECTARRIRSVKRFRGCRLLILPNSFVEFGLAAEKVRLIRSVGRFDSSGERRLLLMSGHGPNKDFSGVCALLRHLFSVSALSLRVDVVGFGAFRGVAMQVLEGRGLLKEYGTRIHVHGYLESADLLRMYSEVDVVWVHSLAEGFGRPVAEARIMGAKVVASGLAVFKEFSDSSVYFYRNSDPASFVVALESAMTETAQVLPYKGIEKLRAAALAAASRISDNDAR
jgi:hypothetical protein